jgi:hypothetical protein
MARFKKFDPDIEDATGADLGNLRGSTAAQPKKATCR